MVHVRVRDQNDVELLQLRGSQRRIDESFRPDCEDRIE